MQTDSALAFGLRVLRRRWYIGLGAVIGAIAAAGVLSSLQTPRYEASAEVLLNTRDVAATVTGSSDAGASLDPERNAQTQADVARVPALARRVLQVVGLSRRPGAFLDASDVSPKSNADLLVFRVRDGDPALAKRLATAYARQYTLYRLHLDSSALEQARREVSERLTQLRRSGEGGSALYGLLLEKEQQLETLETLQASNASLARPATVAVKTQPRLGRNLMLALALGLLLGGALMLARDTFDTRLRSADEAREILGLPLFAQVPNIRDSSRDRSPILVDPAGRDAEAFRILRTNLAFATLEQGRKVRTIMVTSAVEQEGKSTTAANLALVLARAGTHVVLVDLDLRHPSLGPLFGLEGHPGLTNVALGDVPLGHALTRTPFISSSAGKVAADAGAGTLDVLCTGPLPPDPGEFVVKQAVADILAELEERADLVIVDAPPLLPVGDARALTAHVGGVLVVARLALARRPLLEELRKVLDSSPVLPLGLVLVGVGDDAIAGYERETRRHVGRRGKRTRLAVRPAAVALVRVASDALASVVRRARATSAEARARAASAEARARAARAEARVRAASAEARARAASAEANVSMRSSGRPRVGKAAVVASQPLEDRSDLSSTNGASSPSSAASAGIDVARANGAPVEPLAEAHRLVPVRLKLDEASLEDLVGLPGIGEARATRIIEYRSQNGSFRSLDELGEATGMNGALLEQLGELIEL